MLQLTMSDIERIKESLDIVEIIGNYVSDIKKAGSNYKAVCPFHNEKTPSFMINPNLQIYKCFGCGKGGDVLSFLQEIERLDFRDALELAAEKAGVELTQTNFKNTVSSKEKDTILKANKLATQFYNHILSSHKLGEPGRKYAKKRNITGELITEFKIGYAPSGYENLKNFLVKKGFKVSDLVKWGLLIVRDTKTIDKFRNRLLQPIFDERGNIVGFSGRYIGNKDNVPKYLNSPETLVYKKHKLLYGLYHAKDAVRESKNLILVEGNIDVLSSHRVGIKHIAAPLGTSFTIEQAKRVKQIADEVLFCFDSDNAGFTALVRALEIAESVNLPHKVIPVEPYQDADELIIKDEKLWTKKISKPLETLDYIKTIQAEKFDLGNPSEKNKFYIFFLDILRKVNNTIQRNFYIKDLSFMLDIPEEDVRDDLEKPLKVRSKGSEIQELTDFSDYVKEEYAASLIIQNQLKELDLGIFSSPRITKLLELFIKSNNFKSLTSNLDTEQKTLFEKLSLVDLSHVGNPQEEFIAISNQLKKIAIQKSIHKLQRESSTIIEEEKQFALLQKVNELTKQLASLS